MTGQIWIPGKFSLTNKMLSNLRAAEKWHGPRRPKGWRDLFEEETAAIRLAAKVAGARADVVRVSGVVCALAFGVFGHHRHDPDAWYLLAKTVVDGFVDAGLLAQDRADVWDTGGRVMQSREEEEWWVKSYFGPCSHVPAPQGVLVWLSFFERPVGRVGHA